MQTLKNQYAPFPHKAGSYSRQLEAVATRPVPKMQNGR